MRATGRQHSYPIPTGLNLKGFLKEHSRHLLSRFRTEDTNGIHPAKRQDSYTIPIGIKSYAIPMGIKSYRIPEEIYAASASHAFAPETQMVYTPLKGKIPITFL